MPVFQKLVNFDRMFHQLSTIPVIINDLPNDTQERKNIIKDIITTRYSSDMLSVLPQCVCGALKGEYVIGSQCVVCDSVVKINHELGSEPTIWFRAPNGIAPIISPIVLLMLRERFYRAKFCTISYLIDPHYRCEAINSKVYKAVVDLNIPRSYNYFVTHFDEILSLLINHKVFKNPSSSKHDYLMELINTHRDCVFSQYLPLPNKSLLIIEFTAVGTYVDPIIVDAINAIETLIGLESPNAEFTNRVKETRTAKALGLLADYYINYFKSTLSKKEGVFRKHIFGSRTHFSFRGVISSITEPHNYDEIYLPWGMANALLRPHLINKLKKLGYSLNQSIELLHSYHDRYHPTLEKLHTELINETGHGGIYTIFLRNPSLMVGSELFLKISKIKTDPADLSIGFSILTVSAPNADFDGDALQGSLAIDEETIKAWRPLSPHASIFELTSPRKMSGHNSLPKPVLSTISNWLVEPIDVDQNKRKLMEQLFT